MSATRTKMVALGLAIALTSATRAADAQTAIETRNFSAERFRLALDRNGILDVEWAEVPKHLSWDLSFWMGVADDPLSIYRVGDDRRKVGRFVDTRVGGSLILALGLFDWVQIGIDLPVVLYQDRPDTIEGVNGTLSSITSFGIGSPRIAPKIRILSQESFGVSLAFIPGFVIPTASQDSYIGQDSLLFEPELVLSRSMGLFRAGANLGVRLRRPAQFVDLEVDDEIYAQVGGALGMGAFGGPPVELEGAISMAFATRDTFSKRNQNHVEALAGATYQVSGPLIAFAAGGVGLAQGHGTPDWRLLAGLRFSEHERDGDHDGVADDDDLCPQLPEDVDGFEDRDGCPEPDNDGDGVLDGDDGAPMGPEDKDGHQDADGIPDPDNDGDGVWDWDDRCPNQSGPMANLGCPDEDGDGDGVADRLDACPQSPEDPDGFEDSDGCPDPDNDGDGVLDASDRCPEQPGPPQGEGCPDLDGDGDGVVDRLDNCPEEPGSRDNQGCKKKQLVVIQGDDLIILDKVYFATARAQIRNVSFELLDNVAAVLVAHPEIVSVEVQGHTDDQGRAQSNRRLSQRRAEAVAKYLVGKGVAAERLSAKGYGEDAPVASNKTSEGRADNRRVDFKILKQRRPSR